MKPALVKTSSTAIDADRLLAVVGEVTREARPTSALPEISLDSSLERELGLDSLARVELVLRLEREFATSLPSKLLPRARHRATSSAS
jgi:acyl carrier protein